MEAHDERLSLDLDAAAAFDKILTVLPLKNYVAGETVLMPELKTGRLLILKWGAVVVLKDSIEIARVEHPGAVFGELSALLDQPHAAEVRAVKDSQFYAAEAVLLAGPVDVRPQAEQKSR